MRPSTLALTLVALVAAAVSVAVYRTSTTSRRAFARLQAMENKDLHNLPETWGLLDLALKRTPAKRAPFDITPWRVVRLGSRTLVLETIVNHFEASALPVRVHVFSEDGDFLSSETFFAGWCTRFADARPLPDSCFLEIEASHLYLTIGNVRCKQVYALIDDRLSLVRLENDSGLAVPNVYDVTRETICPPPTPPSPEDVEASLASSNDAAILRTMVWLGGRHPERSLASDVRRRPETLARLQTLRKHPNAWIREAAAAVK